MSSSSNTSIAKPSASANLVIDESWASNPRPDLPCFVVLTRMYPTIGLGIGYSPLQCNALSLKGALVSGQGHLSAGAAPVSCDIWHSRGCQQITMVRTGFVTDKNGNLCRQVYAAALGSARMFLGRARELTSQVRGKFDDGARSARSRFQRRDHGRWLYSDSASGGDGEGRRLCRSSRATARGLMPARSAPSTQVVDRPHPRPMRLINAIAERSERADKICTVQTPTP
jgi:hypothetical protein